MKQRHLFWLTFKSLLICSLLHNTIAKGQTNLTPQNGRQALTRFDEIHQLTEGDARQRHPVLIDAWVVAIDRANHTMSLRDLTGAWELESFENVTNHQVGEQVHIEANTRWNSHGTDLVDVRLWTAQRESPPKRISLGDPLPSSQVMEWCEVEGVVEFAGFSNDGLVLDILSHRHHLEAHLVRMETHAAASLVHRRIRIRGVVQGGFTAEGDISFGRMWAGGLAAVHLMEPSIQDWKSCPLKSCAQLQAGSTGEAINNSDTPPLLGSLVRIAGQIEKSKETGLSEMIDESGSILVDLPPEQVLQPGTAAEALGILGHEGSRCILFCGCLKSDVSSETLLTTIDQIHRLKPEEAGLHYPVRIRGVATGGFAYIQDATRGISVSNALGHLDFGGYYEIEGTTGSGLYAPVIEPTKITYLGIGQLPEPIHPTWERLASGSEVCQWLELKGMVLGVSGHTLTIAIPGGRVEADIQVTDTNDLPQLENAVIRIRGTCRSEYNLRRQITRFWIDVPSRAFISVEDPPRRDPFDEAGRSLGEIQQFDVDAYQVRRIKVTGQVTYHAGAIGYLTDGTNGIKYSLKENSLLQPGDVVEMVGLPDAGGFSPVLREAIWRRIGHNMLPAAGAYPTAELLHGDHNATRVRVEGRVLVANPGLNESVLTVLVKSNVVVARVQTPSQEPVPFSEIGSKIELSGICAGPVLMNSAAGRTDAFELLVQSPADVAILERPTWWSLKHSLQVIGTLTAGLAFALAWVHLLRARVTERTRQLKEQMQETERTKRQRLLEQERSRIARDLHDNLGSSLTEISMLAETGRHASQRSDNSPNRFTQIMDRARVVVRTLDETVWAIDPAKDTLPSLIRYLAGFAEEFVSAAGMTCRVEVPSDVPPRTLTADVRHDLFLATKEALNNAVCHSQGHQVTFRITITGANLEIAIIDDGRGFDATAPTQGNGVRNLRHRMSEAGRKCEIASQPGSGTMVLLAVKLPVEEVSPAR